MPSRVRAYSISPVASSWCMRRDERTPRQTAPSLATDGDRLPGPESNHALWLPQMPGAPGSPITCPSSDRDCERKSLGTDRSVAAVCDESVTADVREATDTRRPDPLAGQSDNTMDTNPVPKVAAQLGITLRGCTGSWPPSRVRPATAPGSLSTRRPGRPPSTASGSSPGSRGSRGLRHRCPSHCPDDREASSPPGRSPRQRESPRPAHPTPPPDCSRPDM